MDGRIQLGPAESADALFPAGTRTRGEFRCSECGYGVMVYRELPRCPMCFGDAWEETGWSPFAHSGTVAAGPRLTVT